MNDLDILVDRIADFREYNILCCYVMDAHLVI